ncbi:MAG: hypothetical protein IJ446_00545 [Oscillospiraceae bacterium]|nr:hypothetical protein [Oscillospiraceae bacterium]
MAETNYIKTVTFGGYDKNDVKNRLNYLYSQVFELKNELRELKQFNEETGKGADAAKAEDTVLSAERAKLTMVQVQNETLTNNVKEYREECKAVTAENEALKEQVKKLTEELEEANKQIMGLSDGNGAASLSKVFIEAQKSADMLVEDAKKQAADLEANAKKLADNMIIDANNEAARIVYDAEREAAAVNAKLAENEAQMKVTSDNLKAVLFEDVKVISDDLAKAKAVFEAALAKVSESEKLLSDTTDRISSGGIPVFRMPEKIEAAMPEAPVYQKTDDTYIESAPESKAAPEEEEKRSDDLDKLMAMADSLSDDSSAPAEEASAPAEEKPASNGGIDLEALTRMANALES